MCRFPTLLASCQGKPYLCRCTVILSHSDCYRGLLLPKIVVDDFGGTRTDPGMLGSGLYFANAFRLHNCL